MNNILFSLFIVFYSFFGFSQDISKTITTTIDPYKTVTNGAFFQVITLHSKDCSVEYLQDFDFEWGYSYNVTLKETQLENPPEDGSCMKYDLLSVNSKTKAPNDFVFGLLITKNLYLGSGDEQVENLVLINDSTYRYMDEINILFTPEQQKHFDLVRNKNHYLRAKFVFDQPGYIRMVAP